MVNLMLDDLGCPAGVGFQTGLQLFILVPYLDGTVPFCLSDALQGETALLGLIRIRALDNFGIEHEHIASRIVEDDDSHGLAYHVRGHADAALPVGRQCVQQIPGDRQILRRGFSGFPPEKNRVLDDGLNHASSSNRAIALRYCPEQGTDGS